MLYREKIDKKRQGRNGRDDLHNYLFLWSCSLDDSNGVEKEGVKIAQHFNSIKIVCVHRNHFIRPPVI